MLEKAKLKEDILNVENWIPFVITFLITKARIQGNAVVVTIPKSLGVEPGTEYRFSKESDGSLKLTPTKKVPETMAELFKGWHGKYETPTDLQDWDSHDPAGEEL